jgi:hypothetical protein
LHKQSKGKQKYFAESELFGERQVLSVEYLYSLPVKETPPGIRMAKRIFIT